MNRADLSFSAQSIKHHWQNWVRLWSIAFIGKIDKLGVFTIVWKTKNEIFKFQKIKADPKFRDQSNIIPYILTWYYMLNSNERQTMMIVIGMMEIGGHPIQLHIEWTWSNGRWKISSKKIHRQGSGISHCKIHPTTDCHCHVRPKMTTSK